MLNVGTYVCGSCAGSSIHSLGSHTGPGEAMSQFCKLELGEYDKFAGVQAWRLLAPFYVFIAGPEVKAGQPGSSHHSKAWVKYGTEFAAFILENGLGQVATLAPKLNAKHHATTTCQIWIWSPDQEAMGRWWERMKK